MSIARTGGIVSKAKHSTVVAADLCSCGVEDVERVHGICKYQGTREGYSGTFVLVLECTGWLKKMVDPCGWRYAELDIYVQDIKKLRHL